MEYSLKPVDYDPFDEDPASPPEIPGFKLRPVSYDPFAEDKPELSMERVGGAIGEGVKDVARTTMHTLAGVTEYGLPEPYRTGVEAAIPALKATRLIPGAITKPVAEKFKESASSPLLETAPEYAGKSSGWIEDFARSAPQMGTQIIATLAGGPLAGMGLMGLQITGSTYENAIKAGKDPKNALAWGIANAIVQSPMEQIGVGKISKLWKPQQTIIAKLKEIGEAAGVEWLTEFLQSYPDSMANIFATNPDKTAKENLKKFRADLWETTKQGAYEGTMTAPWALLGAGGIRRAKAPGIVEGGPEAAPAQPAEDQQAAMAKKLEADYLTGDVTIETIPEILKQVPKDSPIYQTGQRLLKDYQQLQAEQPIDLGVPETIPKAIAKEEPVAEQAPAYVPEDMEKQEQLFDLNKGLLQERLAQEAIQNAIPIRLDEKPLLPGEETGLGVPAPAGQLIQGAEQEALRPGPGEIGQNIQLQEPEKPSGPEQPVALPEPVKPTAVFVGWQERPNGKSSFALYNIIGGESHGSTVSWPKLAELGIEIPKTPPMPVKEKAKPVPKPKPQVKTTETKVSPTYAASEIEQLREQAAQALVNTRGFNPSDAAEYAAKLGGKKELTGFILDNTTEALAALEQPQVKPTVVEQPQVEAKAPVEAGKVPSPSVNRAKWFGLGKTVNLSLPRESGLKPTDSDMEVAAKKIGISKSDARKAWEVFSFDAEVPIKEVPELQPKEVIPRGEEKGQEGQREALLEKEPAPQEGEGQATKQDRASEIKSELAKLQTQYEKKMAKDEPMVPTAIKADALKSIAKKIDKLDAELAKLEPTQAPAEGVAAPKEAKPAKVVLSKEDVLKKKQEQFKANIAKGKLSQPRTIREWIKRKGGIDPNDPGWKGELSGLTWKLVGGRKYRINLDLFRGKAKGGKAIDELVAMWNEEFPHRAIERGDDLFAMIESNTPLERGAEEKEKADIEEHGKKEQKDFFEKEEQTLNAATLLFGLTESPEKARMALEKKYGETWYWSRKFNEDLAKAAEEADRRRLDEVRAKVAGYLEGQGYDSSLASEVLNDDALLKKTLDLIDEETAIGNEIREQQSLFNKPKEEFKLKPSESTPLEQAALRGEKKAKLPEGEKIRAKIPEGKIQPPTSGRQDSFLNNKQKDLFAEGIDKLPDSDVSFINVPTTEKPNIEFGESKPTESTKALPPRQWVRMATTGSLRAAGNVVSDSGDVASLLASIRRSPQEFFYTVATDKNGVILQIHKYVKGTSTAAAINITEVAGSILRIPDVAIAYLVHNHPAHSLIASPEDRKLSVDISDALQSRDILTNSVIISGTGYRGLDNKGNDLTFEEKIKPVSRKILLPVVERKNLLKIKGYSNAKPVTNHEDALETALKYGGDQDGILLLDRRNRPTAFLPFVKGRTFKDTTADIIKLSETTNSDKIVIKNDTDSQNRKDYIDLLYQHEGIGPDLVILDVLEKGKSRVREKMPKRVIVGQFGPGTMAETLLRAEGEKATLSPENLRNAADTTRYVYQFMRMAGAPQEVLDRIKVEAGPFIDLRGKNYEQSRDEWVAAGGDPNNLFGAVTVYNTHAVVQLATNLGKLEQLELTSYHEWYHIAKRWMMTQADADAVSKFFPGEEGRNGEAESFARFARSRRIEGVKGDVSALHRLWMKLRRYLQIIANGLKGKGWTRPEDIFGKVYVGAYRPKFEGAGETRFTMAGTRAKIRPSGLSNAIERLAKGENEQDIWRETGWKLGPEGKWRWEIDDSKATLKPAKEWFEKSRVPTHMQVKLKVTLADVLDHPILFKHYPQLKEIPFQIDPDRKDAFFDGTRIVISEDHFNNMDRAKRTLFHEIQHAIQEIEGFSRGGNPESSKDIIDFVMKLTDEKANKIENSIPRLKELTEKANALQTTEAEEEELGRLQRQTGIKELIDKQFEIYGLPPEQIYNRLFGEIESRDTASRLDYDTKMRRLIPPYEGQGIPRDQWIVTDGVGTVTSFEVEMVRNATANKGDILSAITSLQPPGQPRALVSISELRDKVVGEAPAETTNKYFKDTLKEFERKGEPSLINAEWEKVTVPIQSLRKNNKSLFEGKWNLLEKSKTEGPIILDHSRKIIDGNHRVSEALARGEKDISVLRPVVAGKMTNAEFDAQLLQLSREGKVALHKHDFPGSLTTEARDKLLKVKQSSAYMEFNKNRGGAGGGEPGYDYYVGVVPKGETLLRADPNEDAKAKAQAWIANWEGNAIKEVPKPEHSRFRALESLTRPFNDFMYWIVDKNRPIQLIQSKLEKVGDEIDVFLKETQRPKRTAAQVKQAWNDSIRPMLKKMAEFHISIPDLEEYSHAKHAHEANIALRHANAKRFLDIILGSAKGQDVTNFQESVKEDLYPEEFHERLMEAFKLFGATDEVQKIKKQWDKFSERPSGMSDSEATEILKKYKGDRNIEEIRLLLADINNNKLQILYDAGLVPDEEYEAIKKKYKFYVPLHREGYDDTLFGSSRGLKPSGRPIKVRGGSIRNVVNIVGNSISNLEKAINLSEKAISTKALKGLVDDNPDPAVWRLKAEKKSPHFDSAGNIRMYPDMFSMGDNEFRFMADGKQYILEVNRDDKDAMLMLRTLRADDSMSGPIVNTLSKVNRFLARVNTSWSPEFVVTNFARDLQSAGINIRDTDIKSKRLFRGAIESARAIYRVEREKQKGDELETLYGRFKKSGGKIGWSDVHGSVERLSKGLTKDLEILEGKRPVYKRVRDWMKWIEDANTSVENGVRLHTFKLAVDQGITDERAAQIASDLTVDFTKKGAAGPVINSLYLFANAGIQGSYRIVRAGIKSPKVRYIMAGIVGAGFLNGLLNSISGGDDDDGEDYFNKIDDFVRERNAIFMIPGTKGKYVKLPLPWGYNFMWNVGNEMSRAFTKQNYDPIKGAARIASVFANAFNPVASGTLLQTIAPTILDPFAQVAENKNWFGGDLMPAKNIFEKTPTPDSQRYWKSARGLSVWVAGQLNSLTGGDKIKQGAIDVSPETLDLIVDTLGGSALRFFTDIADVPQKMLREEKTAIHQYPFVRRVAGEPSEWANSKTYHENVEEVFVAQERLKAYRGTDMYQTAYEDAKSMKSLFGAANWAESNLRKLRTQKKAAEATKNKEAVKRIEERMNEVYVRFNKWYNEAALRQKQ